ncbi:hypothetical protein BC937DRAFT_90520 [Endogone sp. FLAS-F59071]|nr:hypothetical protein BC937DRAFT_90520 [Endogone sp. FLAS-F59071]|eukprot:RUS17022.1 hypothetical protein BC937DRAFT_90520 [Endogone sp. FLAS-F59071]
MSLQTRASSSSCCSSRARRLIRTRRGIISSSSRKTMTPSTRRLPASRHWRRRILNTTAYILTGTQSITKFNETGVAATNLVGVLLAVIRLPHVTTDLVVSYNLPLALGPQSSSSLLAAARPANPEVGLEEFRKVVVSLTVVDWGLFN